MPFGPRSSGSGGLDPAGVFTTEALERLYREAYSRRLAEEIDRIARATPDSAPEGARPRPSGDAFAGLDPAGIFSASSIALFYREVYFGALAREVDRVSGSPPNAERGTVRPERSEGRSAEREAASPAIGGVGAAPEPEETGRTLLDTDPGTPSGAERESVHPERSEGRNAERPARAAASPVPDAEPELEEGWKTLLDTGVIGRDEVPPGGSRDQGRPGSPRAEFASWCKEDHPWERQDELAEMIQDLVFHIRSLGLYAAYGDGEAPAPPPVEVPFRAVLRAVELGLHYERRVEEIATLAREVLLLSGPLLSGDESALRSLTTHFDGFPQVPEALRALPSPKRRGSASNAEVDRAFGEKARDTADLLLRFSALTVLRPEFSNPFHALGVLIQVTATGDWDPLPMRVFLGAAGLVPVGSFVLLSDGSDAVVVATNSQNPLAPQVWLRGGSGRVIDLSLEPELSLKSAVLPAA
ncbi:MAG: hypothetical protein HY720_08910 [Planctomycetes bacterium]|nr:hypothetical protein [Planctomycetota bacterium]